MAAPNQSAVGQLATTINRSLQRAIRDQRNYVETLGEQAIRDGHVHGFVDLVTAGETFVEVNFPLSFLERPVFTCGLEIGNNAFLADGKFPLWSATVVGWTNRTSGDTTLYVGASIAMVVFDLQGSILHYSFQGRSFSLPTGTEQTVSAPL